MKSDKLQLRQEQAIAWITFNNPAKHNAMSVDMWQSLASALPELAADASVRVLILRGAGDKAFVSGADISEFERKRSNLKEVEAYNALSEDIGQKLLNFSKPTIAMVHGYCIGGGLSIAGSCDLRFASSGARFAIPAAKLGIGYRYNALKRLVDLVGLPSAADMFYSARQLDAEESRAIGLVNRVCSADELEDFVRTYAARIAGNAPLSIASAKYAFIDMFKDPGKKDPATCRKYEDACATSQDYKEGRTAFRERRLPVFKGA